MEQQTIKKRVVGVDISLKTTTYAIVDVKGDVVAKDSFATLDYPDINLFVSALSERLIDMVDQNGGYASIRSVGVSSPSANFLSGSIEHAANLPWKGSIPLGIMLRDRTGFAVAVANNAAVRALGEHAYGLAKGMRDFVVLTMGTGLGSCLFSNGLVHKGSDGFAGEIGHTCVVPRGRQCGCGKKGCLEAYVAERGVVKTAEELLAQRPEASLMRQAAELTPKLITDCCEQGDELAQEVYRLTGEKLGFGLANYASIVDPEAFIFTGGVSKAGHWLLDPAQQVFERCVFHNVKGKVKFLLSDEDCVMNDVRGAALLAWEVREYSLFK